MTSMGVHRISVPGPEYEDGHQALRALSAEATSLRGAVAFVSRSGAELFLELLSERPGLESKLVVRGAPVTEPGALVLLAEAGVQVELVVGPDARRFHPKLWLMSTSEGLNVLSGSGNLTRGGLCSNAEQFECFFIPDSEVPMVDRQARRFARLTRDAVSLERLIETPFWSTWVRIEAETADLRRDERALEDGLAKTARSEVAKAQLYEDLLGLYEQTKAEVTILDESGRARPYVATRFKQSIDVGRRDGSIVTKVHGIVRRPTEGFGHLADAGRLDLMVETLVLDGNRPYHFLFSEATKERARANLESQRLARPSRS